MSDTGDIDAAILGVLANDPELQAGFEGVWFNVAPLNVRRFILVEQIDHDDAYAFGGPVFETLLYLIKAVVQDDSPAAAKPGAERIHVLLQDQEKAIPVPGYRLRLLQRVERVRLAEVDTETGLRWQHRGGHYQVIAALEPAEVTAS
jgi:hypothetical protein